MMSGAELLEALLLDNLPCAVCLGGAEDEDAFSGEEEGVHVGDADVGLGKEGQHSGCFARLVLELDGKDIGERGRDALFSQYDEGTLGVVADDAVDAEVLRVGNGGSYYLDASFLECIEHSKQGAALIFDEN